MELTLIYGCSGSAHDLRSKLSLKRPHRRGRTKDAISNSFPPGRETDPAASGRAQPRWRRRCQMIRCLSESSQCSDRRERGGPDGCPRANTPSGKGCGSDSSFETASPERGPERRLRSSTAAKTCRSGVAAPLELPWFASKTSELGHRHGIPRRWKASYLRR